MPVSVILSLLTFVILLVTLYIYGQYWKRKASFAFFLYGKSAQYREDREWAARQALMAGNKNAAKLYALACPEKFDKELPLQPFYRKNIKCVFADYYYPQRMHNWIAEDQWLFANMVYLFKEGKDECGTQFAQAFKALRPASDITIMFMPCSTQERYHTRFSPLAKFFFKFRGVQSGLAYITFTDEREPKHTARQRDKIKENSNYIISEAVRGRKVIIVDDLLTTGKSLTSYAKNLKKSGAEIIGAIFLAKTFQLPSEAKVKWVIWKHFFLS